MPPRKTPFSISLQSLLTELVTIQPSNLSRLILKLGSRREPEKAAEKEKKLLLSSLRTQKATLRSLLIFHLYKHDFVLLILTKCGHYKTEKFKILSYIKNF